MKGDFAVLQALMRGQLMLSKGGRMMQLSMWILSEVLKMLIKGDQLIDCCNRETFGD
jgi:hypothetical protein